MQHAISEEPFEASPFIAAQGFEDDLDAISIKQQGPSEGNTKASSHDEETSIRENNVAKIKVVVS